MMVFEFDINKSVANKIKHGIDFIQAQTMRRWRFMKAKDFDKKFDTGEDISSLINKKRAHRLNQDQKRVNVDFPQWMVDLLDKQAKRLGVTRQSVIKHFIADRLKHI